ncbi:hypothetical protein C8F04DRAFT_1271826 [Mycena alexandri]|uniref:Uncharacterized protein n=1 Tax=Mycena alexandri TaxID=1745969 RepID=A0AAD6WTL0_9AGAR|nr:hypothetical protein C8F04DRAFT_1271826 [Mycena alexandri]
MWDLEAEWEPGGDGKRTGTSFGPGTTQGGQDFNRLKDMDDLNLLATLASAAPPANTVLHPRHGEFVFPPHQAAFPENPFRDNYSNNSQNHNFINESSLADFSRADMGYASIYDVNWTPDYPSSSPSRQTGHKRPPSPTLLLGTSPKRAHLSMSHADVNWASGLVPTLSTANAVPSTPAGFIAQPVGRSRNTPPMTPAVLTTASLQGVRRSPVLVEAKVDLTINKGPWDVDELSSFYEFCLGSDADSHFRKITMSSNKCWKEFMGDVGLARDSKQMKSQWDTSLAIYKKLVPLLKFTGGGADADVEPDWDDKDAIETFLKSRANRGHDVAGLSAKKVKQWQSFGWYKLFHSRYGDNPKAVRDVPRSSADTLSDLEGGLPDDLGDDNNENDSDIEEVKPSIPATPATIAPKAKKGIATDPRVSSWDRLKSASRTPAAKVKKEDRLQGLNNYLEGRVRVDEQAMKRRQKEIVADTMGLYGEEAKEKARRVLEKLLDAALDF